MTLAIFDLDHTLITGDSDYLWGEYMVENRIVDEQEFRARNEIYYQDYQRGTLDNEQYLEFALKPLTQHSIEKLYAWRADYVENWIKPIIAPGARELLDNHRNQNHELLIISATHLFVTAPIAQLLGVPTVLSTEPEIIDNRYTGRYLGTPTYQEGKVTALHEWLANSVQRMDGSYFYSDSINDLALLEKVDHPITVHPDAQLEAIAEERGWPIINLH
jgi:HAD superfamily hydrolase (TIGR01490 family)